MSEKPHKGRIENWIKRSVGDWGYVVYGDALDHPEFKGKTIHTSYVIGHDEATGEIETRNSRYTLVGAPAA